MHLLRDAIRSPRRLPVSYLAHRRKLTSINKSGLFSHSWPWKFGKISSDPSSVDLQSLPAGALPIFFDRRISLTFEAPQDCGIHIQPEGLVSYENRNQSCLGRFGGRNNSDRSRGRRGYRAGWAFVVALAASCPARCSALLLAERDSAGTYPRRADRAGYRPLPPAALAAGR